jgi:hypothetical protein
LSGTSGKSGTISLLIVSDSLRVAFLVRFCIACFRKFRGLEPLGLGISCDSIVPAPLVPAPLLPAPLLPAPLVPAPLVPAPLLPAPLVPAPLVPAPLVPAPLVPAPFGLGTYLDSLAGSRANPAPVSCIGSLLVPAPKSCNSIGSLLVPAPESCNTLSIFLINSSSSASAISCGGGISVFNRSANSCISASPISCGITSCSLRILLPFLGRHLVNCQNYFYQQIEFHYLYLFQLQNLLMGHLLLHHKLVYLPQ